MKTFDLLELENQMNDDFRFVKYLLFLMAAANNETMPADTMNEISHFLVNRVEGIEEQFDTFCQEIKTQPVTSTDTTNQKALSPDLWEIVRK